MALVRTDYGLIYNTDGSLCATLLPEGGVAVTEGTTNMIPVEAQDFSGAGGWRTYQGSVVTVTQGVTVPEWKTSQATRIQTSGGTSLSKYYFSIVNPSVDGQDYSLSVRIKNIGSKSVVISTNLGETETVAPGESKHVKLSGKGNGIRVFQCLFRAEDITDSLDFIAYQPMAEEKPFSTPFVEGTRAAGALRYDLPIGSKFTFSTQVMFAGDNYPVGLGVIFRVIDTTTGDLISLEGTGVGSNLKLRCRYNSVYYDLFFSIDTKINTEQMLTITVDETAIKLYQDGEEVYSGTLNGSSNFNRIEFIGNKNQIYKNLLIRPYAVSPETVATWHSLDAPFFDPREITTAELAAREYAEAQAELARITAEAYADGRVTAEEQARIADAQQKLQEAKQYADQKAAEDIDASKRKIYAGNIEFTGEGQKNTAQGSDGVRRVVYEQDILGNQKYYDKDTGEHMFTITNRGELRDRDYYPIIDINGRYNGKIIRNGLLGDWVGPDDTVFLGEQYVVPEGRQLVTIIVPFYILIPPSDPNKTIKAIGTGDHKINTGVQYNYTGGFTSSNILPAGTYSNLRVSLNHESWFDYSYTDGTSEGIGKVFPAYYEIKEISV